MATKTATGNAKVTTKAEQKRCGTCRYCGVFDPDGSVNDNWNTWPVCRRYPPVAFYDDPAYSTLWPQVLPDEDWCGAWKAKHRLDTEASEGS